MNRVVGRELSFTEDFVVIPTIVLNNGILIDQGILRYDSRILFGSYYGLVLYSSLAVIICFNYLFESLDNPWIYCKRTGFLWIAVLGSKRHIFQVFRQE